MQQLRQILLRWEERPQAQLESFIWLIRHTCWPCTQSRMRRKLDQGGSWWLIQLPDRELGLSQVERRIIVSPDSNRERTNDSKRFVSDRKHADSVLEHKDEPLTQIGVRKTGTAKATRFRGNSLKN